MSPFIIAFLAAITIIVCALVVPLMVVTYRKARSAPTSNPGSSAGANAPASNTPSTGNSATTAPAKKSLWLLPWILTGIATLMLWSFLAWWMGAGLKGPQDFLSWWLTEPALRTIYVTIAVSFIALMFFGAKKHIKVDGDGAMHAVTIVAVIAFIIVVFTAGGYMLTETLYGTDAGAVRDAMRENVAKVIDPRQSIDFNTNQPTWSRTQIGLALACVALVVIAIESSRKGTKK